PRWMTSAPCDCNSRRIMLIAASCPSKSEAALTIRNGRRAASVSGDCAATVELLMEPPGSIPTGIVCILASILACCPFRKSGLIHGRLARRQHTRSLRAEEFHLARRATKRAAPTSPERALWTTAETRPGDRERKREAVILTAARAFRARGYHNTSLDDIAR